MRRIWEQCADTKAIKWDLAGPEECHEIWHGADFIRSILWEGNRRCKFKIGITHLPLNRWFQPLYGYKAEGFHRITFIYVSENSDDTADMEKALLEVFGNKDRCLNKSAGGESAHHGYSPFFVYVAMKYF